MSPNTDEFLDLLASSQSRRLDDQRASFSNLPGLRLTQNNNQSVLGHLMTNDIKEPDEDFFDILVKCQVCLHVFIIQVLLRALADVHSNVGGKLFRGPSDAAEPCDSLFCIPFGCGGEMLLTWRGGYKGCGTEPEESPPFPSFRRSISDKQGWAGGLAGPRPDTLPFGRNVHIETDLIL